MHATADRSSPSTPSPARAVLLGGLAAGALDIVYALLHSLAVGRSPERLLQSIASGIQGRAAFAGGTASAALGLAAHCGILLVAAALYWAASRRLRWLHAQPLAAGALFGVAVWLVMHFVVVPLSAAPFTLPGDAASVATALLVHVLLVGIPIALAVKRWG